MAYAEIMERAAANRYAELADIMTVHNNPEVSELFRKMAAIEWLHVNNVNELSRELTTPVDAVQAGGGDRLRGAEIPDSEDMHYLHTPHHALKLAQKYEQNALDFYRQLAESAKSDELRAAALRLAAEEESHLRELDSWLLQYPEPEPGWDKDFDPPNAID
ncbi:ferritin-like domain-containing protein [Steroidobacter denitrificans]|uniref:ferritin-like domain-containing protein n=1 Tax=Steroidobacter denitrificans TaxID=465721 RepID=UPI001AEFFAC7|nr:ferritin family protein [Steroidobacter denitrificans]